MKIKESLRAFFRYIWTFYTSPLRADAKSTDLACFVFSALTIVLLRTCFGPLIALGPLSAVDYFFFIYGGLIPSVRLLIRGCRHILTNKNKAKDDTSTES